VYLNTYIVCMMMEFSDTARINFNSMMIVCVCEQAHSLHHTHKVTGHVCVHAHHDPVISKKINCYFDIPIRSHMHKSYVHMLMIIRVRSRTHTPQLLCECDGGCEF
jgi:hypothetical protein